MKKSSFGWKAEGSSSVPARKPIMLGSISSLPNSCDPQFGQNKRQTLFPLSAVVSYDFGSPLIFTADSWKNIAGVDALPEVRWQSLQWQLPEKIGSP